MIALVLELVLLSRCMHAAPAVQLSRVTIVCDSQRAIDAAGLSHRSTSRLHKLLQRRIRAFTSVHPNIAFVFAHVPGHFRVPGNLLARAKAKKVACSPGAATNESVYAEVYAAECRTETSEIYCARSANTYEEGYVPLGTGGHTSRQS